MYTIDRYQEALRAAREKGLPTENYWMYVDDHSKDITFSPEENPRKGFTGYFIEDDERIESTVQLAVRRKKR